MTAPPVVTDHNARKAYVEAVKAVTGVVQPKVWAGSINVANDTIAREWPLFFDEEQQMQIMAKFMELRMMR